jgi:AcrR family transcriptional regulator
MPKVVDHEQRRLELGHAVWRVIRRAAIDQASVRTVAEEAGWSAGALRHYVATQFELLAFAMRLVVERIERRIASLDRRTEPREAVAQVLHELLPLDDERCAENEVWLAFTARALIDPELRAQHSEVHDALQQACASALEALRHREELSMIANIIKAPPMPFVPAEWHGKPVVMASMVFAGDAEAGARAIAPIRALAPPIADTVRPIRYPEMYEGPEGPRPGFDAGTNLLVNAFAPGAAEAILEHLETSTAHVAYAQLRVLGGAMARVPDGATAFGHRGAKMMLNVAAMYKSPDERPEHKAWVSSLATALSDGTCAAYVGFLGDDGDQSVRRAYPPATLERLAEVKRRYDPDNLFRRNLNVHPAVK